MLKKSFFKAMFAVALSFSVVGCGQATTDSSAPAEKVSINVEVPDFTYQKKEQVDEWIETNKLDDTRVMYSYEYSETVPQGIVIGQSIPAGQKIEKEHLTITVSNGYDPNAMITFVDFSNMSTEDIQKWFINEHFEKVSVEYVYDSSKPLGTFIGTNIEDNQALRTDPIVIKITGNAEQAGVGLTVPDMNGWTRANVEEWANRNQITVNYTHQPNDKVAKDNVISTTPATGETVLRKDGLSAVISDGNEIVAINVAGMEKSAIVDWGNQNNIQISWMQCWSDLPSGTIYYNQPNTGTMRMGDIMRVYISVGPIPVKDFTSQNYNANFLGWLDSINSQYNTSANLSVTVSQQDSQLADGTIISQYPNSGYINPNSQIQLVIARHVDPQPTPTPTPDVINIPSMTGMSEFDFKHALHAYGVTEGVRTEQYSDIIAKDYILYNDVGTYSPNQSVNYIVSLGHFQIDGQSWYDHDYNELVAYIDNVNRLGANVTLDPSYVDTGNANDNNKIAMVEQLDDGTIHVRVQRLRLLQQ